MIEKIISMYLFELKSASHLSRNSGREFVQKFGKKVGRIKNPPNHLFSVYKSLLDLNQPSILSAIKGKFYKFSSDTFYG